MDTARCLDTLPVGAGTAGGGRLRLDPTSIIQRSLAAQRAPGSSFASNSVAQGRVHDQMQAQEEEEEEEATSARGLRTAVLLLVRVLHLESCHVLLSASFRRSSSSHTTLAHSLDNL